MQWQTNGDQKRKMIVGDSTATLVEVSAVTVGSFSDELYQMQHWSH